MMEKGLYLYCVVAGNETRGLEIKGIDGQPVLTMPIDDLTAVVQECQTPIATDDMKLLSDLVLIHQAVIDLAWERFQTIVPFSFGTVVVERDGKSKEENLREWLERESETLKEKLRRLEGKAEYGVQISWEPAKMMEKITRNDNEVRSLQEEIRSKGTGTAYLLRQKLERLVKERMEVAADAYFKEFFQGVRGQVEEVRVEKVRKEDPSRQMLMNLSCLTPKGETSKLGEFLEKITKIEGFHVRFTGPWPPYSFVNF